VKRLIFVLLLTIPLVGFGGEIVRSRKQVNDFKRSHACPATAVASTKSCPGYVVDHIIPLACNGPDRPSNMQWQTVAEAKAKDKWERKGCKK
jgi:hypothetical protein